MNVSLTPELGQFVTGKVSSGRYTSASEVVREALRLLEEQDKARAARLASFERELGKRVEALDRGDSVEPNVARERLARKTREQRQRDA